MANLARVLVVKRNGKPQPYPTYENVECEDLEGVISLSNGGTRFTALNKRVIPVVYEIEQSLVQLKAICNHCCSSTSVG